jgi:hypothetical protein
MIILLQSILNCVMSFANCNWSAKNCSHLVLLYLFFFLLDQKNQHHPICFFRLDSDSCRDSLVCNRFITRCLSSGFSHLRSIEKWSFIGLICLFSGIGLRMKALFFEANDLNLFRFSFKTNFLLVFLFLLLNLLPMLRSGFYWDDAFHSSRMNAIQVTGESIIRTTLSEIIQ